MRTALAHGPGARPGSKGVSTALLARDGRHTNCPEARARARLGSEGVRTALLRDDPEGTQKARKRGQARGSEQTRGHARMKNHLMLVLDLDALE